MLSRLIRPTTLLAVGFALLAGLLLGAVALSADQQRNENWVDHTLEVQNRLSTLLSTLQDAETGQRGFIITGEPRFLDPYERALKSLQPELDGLTMAVADNPKEQAPLSRLRPLIAQRMEILRTGVVLRATGPRAAFASVAEGQGKAVMDEIRRQIGGMRLEEQSLLSQRQARSAATRLSLRLLLLVGFVGLVGLTVVMMRDSARRFKAVEDSRDTLALINERLTLEASARAQAETQVRQMQKMEAIGQLTGGIAHDFNNMLAIIIGSLEMAKRRLVSQPERAAACMDSALEASQRAANLTARLLAFSRQQPLAPTALDPNKLVGGMSELLRRTVGEQLHVETVLTGGVWRVHADAPQLESAILNLCVNARDAMPDGGHLTIETSNAFLDEDYAGAHAEVASGQYVLISITDTGIGMPPEVIQRAFDPFYTTKGVGRGTGLGLSQVFGFVKQSGGHVKIYSEVGQGSSVKIYLPRWVGTADAERRQVAAGFPRAQDHEIVLVVEDEERVRHVTVDSLRELGYTVVQAGTGAEALQVLALQPRVDLLLTDIIMPGMTGRALADHIYKERPDVKVLYMTGYTRNAIVHNGMLDPGVALLQKPFTTEQLAQKVRDVLDSVGADRQSV